jgi:hypothetical protein
VSFIAFSISILGRFGRCKYRLASSALLQLLIIGNFVLLSNASATVPDLMLQIGGDHEFYLLIIYFARSVLVLWSTRDL